MNTPEHTVGMQIMQRLVQAQELLVNHVEQHGRTGDTDQLGMAIQETYAKFASWVDGVEIEDGVVGAVLGPPDPYNTTNVVLVDMSQPDRDDQIHQAVAEANRTNSVVELYDSTNPNSPRTRYGMSSRLHYLRMYR